ncbi:MAG: hypothetical protein HOL07_06950 [Rhodospirillaceae bacterium]|nr:hypothetical protein [Rhodospirillaceae bacterium]MBT3810970.1 hypothetical protein [Rhodospirillaceae bacterium]MBT3930758.1 hypothetical protein [Rhodospirillaceae bacterium]MBT4773486.1 hypothetical protein [Rhodospirillaceae bacterium]MBT5358072.1 hypothetical protein [Rhodospirillaceae bacterium]
MSRLDSFIRRMQAQRDCLNAAAAMIADVPGPVLELGLGNGRTFDHLREILPDREIFVFDRVVNANPKSTPDAAHLFQGEADEQLRLAQARFGRTVALVHSDLGTGTDGDAALAAAVVPLLTPLLRPGGLLIANNEFPAEKWEPLPLPDGVPAERYFMYRVTA